MKNFLDVKVYRNKKNNQRLILLPRKKIPDVKKVRVIWQ